MDADVRGCLNQIDKSWKAFSHKGKPMTKKEVYSVLRYAHAKGYETTGQLTDAEVDMVINWNKNK